MSVTCAGCGQQLVPTARFCSSCGAPRPSFCAECGSPIAAGAKFCSHCGTRVEEPAAQPGPPEPALPPLPEGLREKFESVRGELQGDRREVVVVFADISGYTAMSERMDPEEVTLLMNRVLQSLAGAVYDFEGYVDKFIGDAVMALFGAPLTHENDPERAVLAGLAMQEVIERHNRSAEIPLSLRVGINVGEVVAAHLGAEGRLQYTVLGDTVNVASRLEGKAAPGSVLVSESVFRRIASRFDTLEVPPLELKGKSEPVRAWQIQAYRGATAALGIESTPFVGRDAELAALERFLRGIETGPAKTLLLEAEPGGGKTRLVREAIARADDSLLPIALSLSPIRLPGQRPPAVEMFIHLLPPTDAPPADRARAVLGPEAVRHNAGIEDLSRALDPDAAGASTEGEANPEASRQNRWSALVALFQAASRERPLILWVEDIHWIGEEASELIGFLLGTLSEARIGFLLTSRPGETIPWLPPEAERLRLEPLGEAAALALLGDLSRELDIEQRRELIRRSQGNPLFLEELVRALRVEGEKDLAAVPGTVHGLIKSRMDRLDGPVQTVLQMAAVLGGRFPTALLQRMYGLERMPMPFDATLAVLDEEGFLSVHEDLDGEGAFRHALMQEVAYGGLLMRLRKVLHESAARLGEEYYADRREAEAAFFGHHYWYAGLEDEAAPHLWIAGRSAAASYDLASAEKYLSRAAQVIEGNPTVLSSADERAQLEKNLGIVLLDRGRLEEADLRFQRLQQLGESEGKPEWEARGLQYRGRSAWFRGETSESQALYEGGLAKLPSDGGRIAADLHNELGILHYFERRPDEALAEYSISLELRRQLDDKLGIAKSLINIGNLLAHLREDLDGAEKHFRQAREIAETIGDRQIVSLTLINLGNVIQARGEWQVAIETLQQADKLFVEMGWSLARYVNLQNQAGCEISLGRIDVALEHLDACLRRGDRILRPINRIKTRSYLFEAYLRAMADDLAAAALDEARRVQQEFEVKEAEMDIRLLEGRWHGIQGRWREAVESFARAAEAARQEGDLSQVALAEASQRRALAKAGEPDIETPAIDLRDRASIGVEVEFLEADALATREASQEALQALMRAADHAGRLGDLALERTACERLAEVSRALGDDASARAALERGARAMEALAAGLPEPLRQSFLAHPRNAPLLEFDVARG